MAEDSEQEDVRFGHKFMTERWLDGLKLIGAANATGLLATGAALNYFATKPNVVWYLKTAGHSFFGGVFAFMITMMLAYTFMLEHDLFGSSL